MYRCDECGTNNPEYHTSCCRYGENNKDLNNIDAIVELTNPPRDILLSLSISDLTPEGASEILRRILGVLPEMTSFNVHFVDMSEG